MTMPDHPPDPEMWSDLELSEKIERIFGKCEWAKDAKKLEDIRDAALALHRALMQDSHLCQWTHRVEELQLAFADKLRIADCQHLHVVSEIRRNVERNNMGDPEVDFEEVVTCTDCGARLK